MKLVGEQLSLLERLEDCLATLVEFLQLPEPVPDGGDGDFVEPAGGFLPVAGDEGDGCALGEQTCRGVAARQMLISVAMVWMCCCVIESPAI